MRDITLKVHYVEDTRVEFLLPSMQLQALFRTAGINLTLIEGSAIDVDPAVSSLTSYPDVVDHFRQIDRTAGHLIVGAQPTEQRKEVAGELLDVDLRGVAAVYTSSDYIQRDHRANYLQTCAHEIGHMLNLAHEDSVPQYDSAMNQVGGRFDETEKCWEAAKNEAAHIKASGQPIFFLPPVQPLPCYPFAYKARALLNTLSDDRLRPWQSKFERLWNGANDCQCGAIKR